MFESIGFFEGPTIAAHMVWPNDDEIRILAAGNVGVVYNPTSNMKTAAGIAPIPEMREAGVARYYKDGKECLIPQPRQGALLQKVNAMDPELLAAAEVLRMATIEGAQAIGLADVTGSLEPGKQADLIQVDFTDAHHVPTYDVISHLV